MHCQDIINRDGKIRFPPTEPIEDEMRISTPQCVQAAHLPFNPSISEPFIIIHGEPRFKSAVNFSIPVSSDLLYFSNNGSLSYGVINIVQSDHTSADALVDVKLSYYHEHILKNIQICLMEERNERGIIIVVSSGDIYVIHADDTR